ncbi:MULTISPECIES: ABCB family ABC transporter ATP-binding protein/permease [Chromobacterium]|uniref:ABC transporter ATP-binding protein/permease n=2 Tax=Chromobacterium TaxID=535 RepID=A0ABS3GHX0_9NEIS|nr:MULTISPECIES: ABC transporter ATP-binding protein/permease [Chromobacterium]AXT46449.1 ABC transporter ATP-binding protein/permease [Chromobacterium rhizoryzae]MBK0413241.1 ABC transporter ATP-binding protein/permease [Chromobacterium haemolyticum]MBO0414343.1 ABC transporter ATP-binding protein/permease [Chromobacterium haemolyticum]MBO0497798.1 ABC transporter ATP-binding protein/permease [Chromobacterium haemolyticum]PTU70238.1 ABC transporter ATP-binding protein/permease [Chromobacteriu
MRFTHSGPAPSRRNDVATLKTLLPYLWVFKWRVLLALSCMVLAKVAAVSVPLYLKDIVDQLSVPATLLALPVLALTGYGCARLLSSVLGELRDAVFARVIQGAVRSVAGGVFQHLLRLSLRFHLERQTGGMSRDIERGTKGIGFLLNFTVFNILPTLLEIGMVTAILLHRYAWPFALVTLGTIAVYIAFTLVVTEWRTVYRRSMNDLDSKANAKAIDALLNYETVKYFNNEGYEAERYDKNLAAWEASAIKNQVSLSMLNAGQGLIIASGVTLIMVLSAREVVAGRMTVGDVVLVATFITQLYAPLNFLGFVYREIKHSLADIERMFSLLNANEEVADAPGAAVLAARAAGVRFEQVGFAYESKRRILSEVSFDIPAGKTLAVVGASGAGKSTLSRLLFRYYDVGQGRIMVNGRDIRELTQDSLRAHIGIVPQDTVLFNDTVYYNIAYGRPGASREEVIEAAKSAHIHDFVSGLPDGYDTMVGERGLKLSGGEKQRVAIARTILKNPPILIFDEATSALDSRTEKAIQRELVEISANRTTLIIAHRLSTIVDADQILVMEAGRVLEQGAHRELLERGGRYAEMWRLQQTEQLAAGDA